MRWLVVALLVLAGCAIEAQTVESERRVSASVSEALSSVAALTSTVREGVAPVLSDVHALGVDARGAVERERKAPVTFYVFLSAVLSVVLLHGAFYLVKIHAMLHRVHKKVVERS